MNNGIKDKRILITGGLGFIGSNLARVTARLGARVTVVDSMIPEYGGNKFNLYGADDSIDVNISDVRDEHSMKHLVQDKDIIFNLAGQTSHIDSMHEPFTDLDINAKAQLSILEACRKYNPSVKIVFASTRQIYGSPEYLPVNEDHPINPVDINGINKLAGEQYHILYNNVYGIACCVLRLTNTYGPRMRVKDARQTFIGLWIKRIVECESFEVWGGQQIRDFTYIDDAVRALIMTATNNKVNGQIYNLGGAGSYSLKNVAEILTKMSDKGCFIVREFPVERKKIDIGDYYSDCSKINMALNWVPRISLQEGLRRTVNYYRRYIKHYV